jgi:hypothetical protein
VPGEVEERAIVHDAAPGLADHRCLHAVVEDLVRDAAHRLEGRHVTTQKRAQVSRLKPSTNENSQTMRVIVGSSVNCSWNCAKSTCA